MHADIVPFPRRCCGHKWAIKVLGYRWHRWPVFVPYLYDFERRTSRRRGLLLVPARRSVLGNLLWCGFLLFKRRQMIHVESSM